MKIKYYNILCYYICLMKIKGSEGPSQVSMSFIVRAESCDIMAITMIYILVIIY